MDIDQRAKQRDGEAFPPALHPNGSPMDFVLQPWQLYLVILAGWMNRQQQMVIDYLRTENQVLSEQLGKKRILLTDDQRRRLAVKGRILGRKLLEQVGTLFKPDTILRWHRQLVAKKWDTSAKRRPGRPRIRQVIVDLILRFAQENPSWGYDRIHGALSNVGFHICDTTVGFEVDYYSRPPVSPAVCIGQIAQHQRNDDGSYR